MARLDIKKMREERLLELEEQIKKATYKKLWSKRKLLIAEQEDLQNKLAKYKE